MTRQLDRGTCNMGCGSSTELVQDQQKRSVKDSDKVKFSSKGSSDITTIRNKGTAPVNKQPAEFVSSSEEKNYRHLDTKPTANQHNEDSNMPREANSNNPTTEDDEGSLEPFEIMEGLSRGPDERELIQTEDLPPVTSDPEKKKKKSARKTSSSTPGSKGNSSSTKKSSHSHASSSVRKSASSSSSAKHPPISEETPTPSSESGMRFDELYRLRGVLGTGAFSTVREGYHRGNPNVSYAVKCVNRKKLSEEDEAALLDEVSILKEMRHIHIIRLYDFFEEPSTYYLVMERMRGGELFDRIVAKAYYNEKEARDTCKVVMDAVAHLHKRRVAHRDLKPENLLLLSVDDDTSVKIADFGFAKRVLKKNSLTTQCGTPGYVAPEILSGIPYDERADMWSVGVILYILLGGYPPFIESTQKDLFRKIRKGDYEFHEEYWGTVSDEAKGLISSLLTVDVSKRLTAAGGLTNQWILGDDTKLAQRDLGTNLNKFRNFNAKRKLRAAVSAIIAMQRLNSLSENFVKKLQRADSQDSGE